MKISVKVSNVCRNKVNYLAFLVNYQFRCFWMLFCVVWLLFLVVLSEQSIFFSCRGLLFSLVVRLQLVCLQLVRLRLELPPEAHRLK